MHLNDKTLSPQEEEDVCSIWPATRADGRARCSKLIEAELKEIAAAMRGDYRRTPAKRARQEGAARPQLDPKEDFMRMLRLSGLDSDGMTDEQRDAFINMAENLGIEPGEAEDLVDLYLGGSRRTNRVASC